METWTTNVQYKGTDICMDFLCPDCGGSSHFDGYFASVIGCPHCGAYFEMPTDLPVKKLESKPNHLAILIGDQNG